MSTINKPNSRNGASYQSVLSMTILRGQMGGGTIIEERRLTQEFGVSRTPLRQALARLEGEGFLYRQAGKLVVKAVTPRDMMENSSPSAHSGRGGRASCDASDPR